MGWPGSSFCIPSDAYERLGRQANWFVDEVQTDIPVTDFGNYYQLHFFGNAGSGLFTDTVWTPSIDPVNDPGSVLIGTKKFFIPSTAWTRLVTIAPQRTGPYSIAVGPSLQAVDATPTLVATPGTRSYNMFVGSNLAHGAGCFLAPDRTKWQVPDVLPALSTPPNPPVFPQFLIPSDADLRLYERYAVYNPTDPPPPSSSPATMFMQWGRFGFPPFTAEVQVSIPSQDPMPKFRTGDYTMPGPHSGHFTMPKTNNSVEYVCKAIEAARRMSDKILLNPNPQPIFTAGTVFLADMDTFVVGQALISST